MGGVEVEVEGHTDTHCSVLHITFFIVYFNPACFD